MLSPVEKAATKRRSVISMASIRMASAAAFARKTASADIKSCAALFRRSRFAFRRAAAAAFEGEKVFGHGPAVVFIAQAVGFRHADIIEEHLVQFVIARQGDDRPDVDSRCPHVDQQKSDSGLRLAFETRANKTEYPIRDVSMCR